jgi:sugar lactone lactonase YvrE
LSGKIYVTNVAYNNGNSSLIVYPANPSGTLNETPLGTITGGSTGLIVPSGIAVDANGKIYVTNGSSIVVYAANPSGTLNEAPLATIAGGNTGLTGSSGSSGIAVDASGKIYVTTYGVISSICVFAANPSGTLNEAPLATITGSSTGLNEPTGVAVDANGKIYVANYSTFHAMLDKQAQPLTAYVVSTYCNRLHMKNLRIF